MDAADQPDLMVQLAARLDRLESELAIRRLAHEYCVGADARDEPTWREVWTPDAVWVTSPDRVMTGTDEIVAGVRTQWEHFPRMQHGTVNHVVDLDPQDRDRATGRSDVVVHVQLPDGRWVTGGGTYLDDDQRTDGAWRIARRSVMEPFDLAPLPPSAGPFVSDES